jgi:Phage protein
MPIRSRQIARRGPTLKPVDEEIFANLNTDELAELAGVNVATARRWKAQKKLPESICRLLEVTALGRLDILGWKGWRLIRGELISPEGWEFQPGDLIAIPFLREQLRAYQVAERAWKAMTPQPEPSDGTDELLARIARGRA